MRFQTVKRIPGRDPELVLGVLEDCLRAVSSDIVREGRRLTLFGLGPSPRAINRNDTTVIDVKAEDGVTTIDADVRYQASAFLGTAPQDVVVQAKLDRVFEAMLTQLGVELLPGQADGESLAVAESPVSSTPEMDAGEVKSSEATDTAPAVEPESSSTSVHDGAQAEASTMTVSSVESPIVQEQASGTSAGEETASETVKAPAETEAVVAGAADATPKTIFGEIAAKLASSPVVEAGGKKAESAISTPLVSQRGRIQFERLLETPFPEVSADKSTEESPLRETALKPLSSADNDADSDKEDAKRSRRLKWSAWIAAIVVLIVAPVAWLYLPSHLQDETVGSQSQPQSAPVPASQAAKSVQPVPESGATKLPGADEDPVVMVNEWETATRSSDAAAQAAFYADPADRYFLRSKVARSEVVAEKQASIDRRKGVWSVKMERIKITRPNDKTARVSLIKHYMVQESGKSASEWFVPSVLQLLRADGRWQITSERDLGWAPTMDELEE